MLRRYSSRLLTTALGAALAATSPSFAATPMPAAERDGPTAQDLCLGQTIRSTAAKAIELWAKGYPFAQVIIGTDGRFGYVSEPSVVTIGNDFVVCQASYRLVRIGGNGKAYTVVIESFAFRATAAGAGWNIALEDLPQTLEGSAMSSRELLLRFTVNGRPYIDVIEDNKRRIDHVDSEK